MKTSRPTNYPRQAYRSGIDQYVLCAAYDNTNVWWNAQVWSQRPISRRMSRREIQRRVLENQMDPSRGRICIDTTKVDLIESNLSALSHVGQYAGPPHLRGNRDL